MMPVFFYPTINPFEPTVEAVNDLIGRVEGGFLNLLLRVVNVIGVFAAIVVEKPDTVSTSVIVEISGTSFGVLIVT
jgi:hypothetical protein